MRLALLPLLGCALPGAGAQMVWEYRPTLPDPVRPDERWGHALAYDEARGQTILFGGEPRLRRDTWAWDGVAWVELHPAVAPVSLRGNNAAAYDARRRVVVTFGGYELPGNETWEWNGDSWTLRSPRTVPPQRSSHPLAYDAARQRVVLFGGYDRWTGAMLGDTWEYDGVDWTQRSPSTSPRARSSHGLAYDEARQRVVLFGGFDGSLQIGLGDTWEWDGTDWIARSPAISPSPRNEYAFAYDRGRRRVVLWGGRDRLTNTYYRDTWEWDGNTWTPRSAATSPPGRSYARMAYDGRRGRMVLFGGYEGPTFQSLDDTWEWDGTVWVERAARPAPGASEAGIDAVAFDAAHGTVLLFKGRRGQTWEWDGTGWRQRFPDNSPGHDLAPAALAHDAVRGRVVMLVARSNNAETWEWDGSDWHRLSTATSPPVRFNHALAYDSARGRIVLFGGTTSTLGSFLDDTWEWDGTTWTERVGTNPPPARGAHGLAYDAARQRTVLFGGTGPTNPLTDTWEWDGTRWTQATPTIVPPPRLRPALGYDAARRRVVVFGGINATGFRADTWEWDGVDWHAIAPSGDPGALAAPTAAYDTARERLVLVGRVAGRALADIWEYRPTTRWAAGTAGAGCTGTAGVPSIDAVGAAIVGNRGFAVRLGSVPPAATVAVLVSPLPAARPLPGGCTLYVQLPVIELTGTSGPAGNADLPLPIPATAALSAASVHAQGIALDRNGAFLNLASFTAELRILIGD